MHYSDVKEGGEVVKCRRARSEVSTSAARSEVFFALRALRLHHFTSLHTSVI